MSVKWMNKTHTSISPLQWLLFWTETPGPNKEKKQQKTTITHTYIRRKSQRCCITCSLNQDGRSSRMACTQRYFHFTLKRLWHPITSPKTENKPYARTCEAIKKKKEGYIYIYFFWKRTTRRLLQFTSNCEDGAAEQRLPVWRSDSEGAALTPDAPDGARSASLLFTLFFKWQTAERN